MKADYLDHLQTPIMLINAKGELEYYNFICSHFFKLPPRKLKKIKGIGQLLKVSDFEILKHAQEALKLGAPIVSPELNLLLNEIAYTVVIKFIPLDQKVLVQILDYSIEKHLHEKYKQHILELKESHEQIVRSDKLTALGEMISGVSHEISSPLTIASDKLLSLAEHLHRKDEKSSRLDLEELTFQFKRIKQIVSNMQNLTRSSDEAVCVINIKTVIENALNFAQDLNLLSGITIELKGESYILGSALKLQQVFINLIKNSIDAFKEGAIKEKRISIHIESCTEQVVVNFMDNGPGVDESEKLFEMFYTTKKLGEGTGLGLPISQKIIESFHGSLSSVKKESGACFRIELPTLDQESFTLTNRYLTGECETEDPKILIFSKSALKLDEYFQHLKNCELIVILTSIYDEVDELAESYMVDRCFTLDEVDHRTLVFVDSVDELLKKALEEIDE